MRTLRSFPVLRTLSVLAVASAVACAGCGGGSTSNERVKPGTAKMSPEEETALNAMTEKAKAEVEKQKLEEKAKPKTKAKTKAGLKGGLRK